MSIKLADQAVREEALDISRSFVVQAPAGSGKTELLTLRYLRLLAVSRQPEEVLAITFTRKAAGEMRDRIVQTLRWAQGYRKEGYRKEEYRQEEDIIKGQRTDKNNTPEQAFERQRLAIAVKVLDRDEAQNWHLLQNPSRLRVQTIDSFCFYLAGRLPVLSRVGGNPTVSEEVTHCFHEAIQSTLALLESEDPIAADIETLLRQLDNDTDSVERLLGGLLRQRDQWLPYVLELGQAPDEARHYLEAGVAELIQETLSDLRQSLSGYEADLVELVNFSAQNRIREQRLDFPDFTPLSALPAAEVEALPYWRLILDLLLIQNGAWRSSVNVRNGFPADDKTSDDDTNKERKEQFKALMAGLKDEDALHELLIEARLLPDGCIAGGQWRFLSALLRVLARLGGELLLAFRKFHLIDYSQTNTAALQALGDSDNPTDLALALDHRIQHILVDEFQDTSRLQLQLLQRLTAGWSKDDGRSLFLVGDAMQSCYGFRNANVGIYLEVRERGINDLPIEPLQLSANFRSQAEIVHWVNQVFRDAFPERADSSRGAVPYAASEPIQEAHPDHGVQVEVISHGDEQRAEARGYEAQRLVQRIHALRLEDPEASIAVLARSRPHFTSIIAALREAGLAWQATDIDRLGTVMVVEDLLSLTRALLSPADDLAWLALLRAPWCGLDNGELLQLRRVIGERPIWSGLQDLQQGDFDAATWSRLQGFVEVMGFAFSMRYRRPLRQSIEAAWTLLRGIDTCATDQELDSAARFFALLEQQENAGGLANPHEFQQQILESFVPAPARDETVTAIQLLTMHKAKGLEFDHVLIPGLSLPPRHDDKPLLQWYERLNRQGDSRLLLATLTAPGSDDDPLYSLLRYEEQQKSTYESTRLLYIAVTRARRSASLYATLERREGKKEGESELSHPPGHSLLARIWDGLLEHPELWREHPLADGKKEERQEHNTKTTHTDLPFPTPLQRFAKSISLHEDESAILQQQLDALDKSTETAIEDDAGDAVAAGIGTLIHRGLELYVQHPDLLSERMEDLRPYWERELSRVCTHNDTLTAAMQQIEAVLKSAIEDSRSNWIFDVGLKDSACELSLTRRGPYGPEEFVIDRTFVDDDDVRWIIDYKSNSLRPGQSEDEFIAEQCRRHRDQLLRYRELFAAMESRPIRTALFLTSLPRLVEIQS